MPYVDTHAAERLFRRKVISFLAAEGLLNEDRIELLSGPDLLRPPLALERLTLEPGRALYRHKAATRRRGEPFDPDELLARLILHIPAPRLHVPRYFGYHPLPSPWRSSPDPHPPPMPSHGSVIRLPHLRCTGPVTALSTTTNPAHPRIPRSAARSRLPETPAQPFPWP